MDVLWMLLKKRRGKVAGTVMLSIGSIIVTLFWNRRLAQIVNRLSDGNGVGKDLILQTLIFLLLLVMVESVLTFVSGCTCETMNADFRMWYVQKYVEQDFSFLEGKNAGQQISKILNELHEVTVYISESLFSLIHSLIKFIGTVCLLLSLDMRLTLEANLPVLGIIVYVVLISKVLETYASSSQMETQRMNGVAETIVTLFPVLKLYDAGEMMKKHYHNITDCWEEVTRKEEERKALLLSISAILSSLPLMLLLLFGGWRVIDGTIAIGTLYIFINLSGNVSGVMMNMPTFIGSYRRFLANMKRL